MLTVRPAETKGQLSSPRRLLLTSFAGYVEEFAPSSERFTQGLPPIRLYKGALDLDYAPFFLYDKVVVDQASFDRVTKTRNPLLRPLSQSLNTLVREGYIDLEDYGAAVKTHVAQIETLLKLERQRGLGSWRDAAISTILGWSAEGERLQRALGSRTTVWLATPMGIYSHLYSLTKQVQLTEVQNLIQRIQADRDAAELTAVLEHTAIAYLREVYINLRLSQQFRCPFFDYENLWPFYEKVFSESWMDTTPLRRENAANAMVRQLFHLPCIQFQPQNAEAFIRIITDPRIEAFRRRIYKAVDAGESLDSDTIAGELPPSLQLLRHQQRQLKLGVVRTILATAMPYLKPIALFAEAREIHEAAAELDKYSWLFFLAGHSSPTTSPNPPR